jgi:hypothetical protein
MTQAGPTRATARVETARTMRIQLVALVVVALAVSLSTSCSRSTASSARSTGSAASGTFATPRPSKLLVVVLENHSAGDAVRQMPRLAAAAARYGRATRSFAMTHPSLPNYLAIAGGSTFAISDDLGPAQHILAGPSVFGQLLAAGKVAKTYAEGMTGACALRSGGRYAVKHNPWPYFATERAACRRYDLPAGTPARGALSNDISAGSLPTFALLIPDLCHDAHDCSLGTADRWLHDWLRALLAGPDFRAGRLAVVVTFDEDDSHAGNHIFTAVLHPSLHGKVVSTRLDHAALSRAVSGLADRGGLRGAAHVTNLLSAFGLGGRP